jgi:hypothetical protein
MKVQGSESRTELEMTGKNKETGTRLVSQLSVTPVDYGGFVDLAVNSNTCQSWL